MTPPDILMTSLKKLTVFLTLTLNPDPQGELYSTNPYTLLIAVVLSAQATDKGVILQQKSSLHTWIRLKK